jgi:hypothetical protein
MNDALRRIHPAITMVALCISLLALVASAAGAGYAAATIGTAQLKNNAVTAPKIKNNAVTTKKIKKNAITAKKVKDGTLSAADMVAEEKQIPVTFANGTEGDCLWQSAATAIPGLGSPTFRKDRSGRVILSGVAAASDAAGGDGSCDVTDPGQTSDGIAFVLPAAYVPAKSQIIWGDVLATIIVGPQGVNVPGFSLPPGAVYNGSGAVFLDAVSFDPVGSSVVIPKTGSRYTLDPRMLKALGLG